MPPTETETETETETLGAPRIGPVAVLVLVVLVSAATLFPVQPPTHACGEDGRHLADVDRFGAVSYGSERSRPTLADARANIVMLEKNNPAFARAIAETLERPHRIFPAYDACAGQLLYVVGDDVAQDRERWIWLRTTPMAQKPLELMAPTP